MAALVYVRLVVYPLIVVGLLLLATAGSRATLSRVHWDKVVLAGYFVAVGAGLLARALGNVPSQTWIVDYLATPLALLYCVAVWGTLLASGRLRR